MATLGWAILGVIMINAGFAFFQEYKAEHAVQALRRLLPSTAWVTRGGQSVEAARSEIGILASKGQSITGQDQDDFVVLPFSTAERKAFGTKFLGTVGIILVATATRDDIAVAADDIKGLLRARHRLHPSEEDDFTIRTMEDIAKTIAGTSRTMMLMLMSIASISLIVGGIGIINILLVSVTERTREIGLRMVVGAKRTHILLQFLMEALIMTAIGGVLGVGTGIGIARLLTAMIGWPTIINIEAVVAAFLFSLVVGLFFGPYPANRASKLNPIEALRYE